MGFLDSIGDFFGGGAGKLASAAASIGGALIGSEANKDAADRISSSSTDAARIAADAYLRGAEIAAQGGRDAQARLEPLRAQSEPAISYLRRVMAQDPSMLTPAQQTMRADLMRRANTTLASSGLRGSGRAVTASIRDVDRRLHDDAYGENLRRADTAAGRLAGVHTSAVGDQAGIDRQISGDRARAVERGGDAFAGATRTAGEADAGAGIANANQWGSAMGMISSLMAQDRKERSGAYPVGGRQQISLGDYNDLDYMQA